MDKWCLPFPGYHLYYPNRRQPSPAFTALVAWLKRDQQKWTEHVRDYDDLFRGTGQILRLTALGIAHLSLPQPSLIGALTATGQEAEARVTPSRLCCPSVRKPYRFQGDR